MQILLITALGFLILIAIYASTANKRKIEANGVEVDGIVFDIVQDNNFLFQMTDVSSPSYPVIRFVTKDKNMTWITEKYEFDMPGLRQGDKVKVIYNPTNPKEFIVKSLF